MSKTGLVSVFFFLKYNDLSDECHKLASDMPLHFNNHIIPLVDMWYVIKHLCLFYLNNNIRHALPIPTNISCNAIYKMPKEEKISTQSPSSTLSNQ